MLIVLLNVLIIVASEILRQRSVQRRSALARNLVDERVHAS